MNDTQLCHQTTLAKLSEICGADNVLASPALLEPYVRDWRQRYHGTAMAVVFPDSTQQIQQIVGYCQKQYIAIVTQGGNTSTCGAATPLANYPQAQLILNMCRMNRILNLDSKNQSINVEAGCTLQQIQEYAAQHNWYFPLSLASEGSCQIGGNLATNAGGVQVLKYGMIRNLTLGLEVVLADGSLSSQLLSLRKNNTYLDLKQLFIGSEGTLGIITKASLQLYPIPEAYCSMLIGIDSLKSALELLAQLRRKYTNNVSACEIIKRDSWQLYRHYYTDSVLQFTNEWLLLIELETNSEFNLDNLLLLLEQAKLDLNQCVIASNQSERAQMWAIREHIPLAEKQHGYAAKHDISLPLSQLDAFLKLNMPKLHQLYPQGYFSIFGHLGDGNLHYNFGLPGASQEDVAALETHISPVVYADVVALGGSIAAEHGIGLSKKAWFKHFSNPGTYQLLRQIKTLLDPHKLFNPGKIF